MKRSISLLLLAAGWLLSTAPAGLPPGCPTLITPGWAVGQSPLTPRGPSASMIPWLARVLNGDPRPLAAGRVPSSPGLPNPRVVEAYGLLPLSFEANQGQTAPEVKFLARGSGYALFLTPAEAVLTLRQPRDAEAEPLRPGLAGVTHRSPAPAAPPTVVRLKLVGANPHPTLEGMDELPGKVNYLRGNDPQQWRTNVPTYGKVKYSQAYPGIDLVYYGNPRQLEHDFVVAPGADPSVIGLELEGAGKACLDARGDLVWATGAGEVRLQKPHIYQEVAGRRREVAGGYAVRPGQRVGFRVGAYDARRPLVIDPVLVYATYLGGNDPADSDIHGGSQGRGIAVDASGNAYVTGSTTSTDFPGAAGSPIQPSFRGLSSPNSFSTDAFVAKLNAAGTALVYATYLGGSLGGYGSAIAVDAAGNAYVTGGTASTDFPLAGSPLQSSPPSGGGAFVAKLNAAGSALAYSTYLGGSGGEEATGIAVDALGNAYLTGSTGSTDFPLAGSPVQSRLRGGSDAFVAKLNAAGSALVYATYLGGNGSDAGLGIAVDALGNAYVTGSTGSTDFPLAGSPVQPRLRGSENAFVAKLNASGSALVYATYLGGSGDDEGHGIAVDAAGNAYVTGYTHSTDFPLAGSPLQSSLPDNYMDAFVAKLNAAGTALVYATYLGGNIGGYGSGIAVDAAGNAYVTGTTSSTDFPGTAGSPIQPTPGGGDDAFVAKLNASGSALVYATYLGGSDTDGGSGIAVDALGNAYVTGTTQSTDFPLAGSPLQPSLHDGRDAFVAKIASDLGEGARLVPPSQVATTASGLAYSRVSQTFNGTLTLTNFSAGAIGGPVQILFTGLSPGVALVNATNTLAGTPYLTVPALASLPPGQSVTLSVQFKDPSNAPITFTPAIYSGSF
jgi:hypothetical protein